MCVYIMYVLKGAVGHYMYIFDTCGPTFPFSALTLLIW